MNSERPCFCELAPLYVLDLLSESERQWVDQQLIECPELAEELAEYETAAGSISYSVPIAPMADNLDNLKGRLFESLELTPPQPQPSQNITEEGNFPPFLGVRPQDLQWKPHRVPKVETAVLHADFDKREIVCLLRAEPEMNFPMHRHGGVEEIYMLAGDLTIGDETYGVGDYIRSQPGSTHPPAYSQGGCMFLLRASMDNEFPDLVSASV